MTMYDISILKNTLDSMASDADDKGKKDFAIRLTVKDAFALCRLEPVRHGHWEEIRNAYGELEGWLCKCGREVTCKENYCPNCGAKMDEVSE